MTHHSTGSEWLDARPRLARAYGVVAPVLLVLCLLASLFASTGVFWLTVKRGEDQRVRTASNTALLKCFDKFATDLSGSLPPVRKATQARDQATEARDKKAVQALTGDDGLKGALEKAATGSFKPADMTALLRRFGEFQAAADRVTAASRRLEQARKDNPYPPPPSKFCSLP